MRKMKLEIDRLTVESFPTLPSDGAKRGTVRGHAEWQPTIFYPECPTHKLICITYPTGCPCTPRAGDF